MLTRIEVDGFKSLRNFSLDLEPCMAFVGANSAGKSNILDALALLSRLVSMPVREALKGGRGHIRDQFSLGKDGHTNEMSFAVEVLLPPAIALSSSSFNSQKARYEFTILRQQETLNGTENFYFVNERVVDSSDKTQQQHDESAISQELSLPIHHLFEGLLRARMKTEEEMALLEASSAIRRTILETLRNFQFSQVEPSHLRESSEAADATTLSRDGSNLPTVFAALPPETQARVRANLIRFVPGLRDVEAKKRDDEFYIEVTSQDGRRFPARILSDGTLRILALLALLYSSPPGSLIALEELENGIYPGQFIALLEALEETTRENGVQLLLTSHSPTVMSVFKDKPQSLVFVDMVTRAGERVTRARQIKEKPTDRGATSISRQEVESILESTQPEGAP